MFTIDIPTEDPDLAAGDAAEDPEALPDEAGHARDGTGHLSRAGRASPGPAAPSPHLPAPLLALTITHGPAAAAAAAGPDDGDDDEDDDDDAPVRLLPSRRAASRQRQSGRHKLARSNTSQRVVPAAAAAATAAAAGPPPAEDEEELLDLVVVPGLWAFLVVVFNLHRVAIFFFFCAPAHLVAELAEPGQLMPRASFFSNGIPPEAPGAPAAAVAAHALDRPKDMITILLAYVRPALSTTTPDTPLGR